MGSKGMTFRVGLVITLWFFLCSFREVVLIICSPETTKTLVNSFDSVRIIKLNTLCNILFFFGAWSEKNRRSLGLAKAPIKSLLLTSPFRADKELKCRLRNPNPPSTSFASIAGGGARSLADLTPPPYKRP